MFGLINVNKPSGITSRDVVDRVQRLVRPVKVGHSGTLDPLATGVLIVCVGPATRLVPYLQQLPKSYLGTFLLGCTSPTEDTDGVVTQLPAAPVPSREQLALACKEFEGVIEQRPPAYSAIKVGGKRAYALARAGTTFELEARPVTIHRIAIVEYAYPELRLDIECGSGTYVRSLGRALAEHVGTGAVMSGLVRTAIGPFRVENSVELTNLSSETLTGALQNPREAVDHLPQVKLDPTEVLHVFQGQCIQKQIDHVGKEACAVDDHGRLIAILAAEPGGILRPLRCFIPKS